MPVATQDVTAAPAELGSGLRERLELEQLRRLALGFDGPLSPELVLVSPPELAELARELMPPYPLPWAQPRVPPARPRVHDQWAAVELAGFVVFCVIATVGPLLLLVVAR